MTDYLLAPQISIEVFDDRYRVEFLDVKFLWSNHGLDEAIQDLMAARRCEYNFTKFLLPAGEQLIDNKPLELPTIQDITTMMNPQTLTALFMEAQRMTKAQGDLLRGVEKILHPVLRPGESIQRCLMRLVKDAIEAEEDHG